MKIRVEASGLQMADNSITESVISGVWGIRLGFQDENNLSKFDVVLTEEQAKDVIHQIEKSLGDIKEVNKKFGHKKKGLK